MLIACVNNSSTITNADAEIMCAAVQIQFDLHVAPAWNQKSPTVKFYTNIAEVPGYAWVMYLIDTDDQVQGALGYHQEETYGGKIDGYVMCATILSNGGAVLKYDASNPSQYTVSGTLSHEMIEMFGDRFANGFSLGPQLEQGNLYAQELCDPVEDLNYGISVNGTQVAVSDFVFPSWFNQYARIPQNIPFDYCNKLIASFTMSSGGYFLVASLSNEGQVEAKHIFGSEVPQWKKDYIKGKCYRRNK